jgi:hypothetical protein
MPDTEPARRERASRPSLRVAPCGSLAFVAGAEIVFWFGEVRRPQAAVLIERCRMVIANVCQPSLT